MNSHSNSSQVTNGSWNITTHAYTHTCVDKNVRGKEKKGKTSSISYSSLSPSLSYKHVYVRSRISTCMYAFVCTTYTSIRELAERKQATTLSLWLPFLQEVKTKEKLSPVVFFVKSVGTQEPRKTYMQFPFSLWRAVRFLPFPRIFSIIKASRWER